MIASLQKFPSAIWYCTVEHQQQHPACKNCVIRCWCGYLWSKLQIICIGSSWCHCHLIIYSFIKCRTAYLPGASLPTGPGKEAIMLVSVCILSNALYNICYRTNLAVDQVTFQKVHWHLIFIDARKCQSALTTLVSLSIVMCWWVFVINYIHISGVWCCWLGNRKGIQPVKTEWWGARCFQIKSKSNQTGFVQTLKSPGILE